MFTTWAHLKEEDNQCQVNWALPTSLVLGGRARWLLSVSQSCFPHRCPLHMADSHPRALSSPRNENRSFISLGSIITSFLNQSAFCFVLLFPYMSRAPQCSRLREALWLEPSRSSCHSLIKLSRAPGPLRCCRCVRVRRGGGCGRSLAPCWVGWHRAPLSIGPPACPDVCWGLPENRAVGRKPSPYTRSAPMRTQAASARDKRTSKKKRL